MSGIIVFMRSFLKDNLIPIKIWLVYTSILSIFPFIVYLLGLSTLPFDFRVYLIDFWGYYWDGMHYIKIATQGYEFPLFAFFPGYPLLIKIIDLFLPLSVAYRVNILISLLTIISLYKFMDLLNIKKDLKLKSLILFLAYPVSFFLFANYVESLYILISIWILYFMQKNNYFESSLLTAILSSIKISAVILPAILFIRLIKQKFLRFSFSSKNLQNWGTFFILGFVSILGILIYFLYLNQTYETFKIYFTSQATWGRGDYSSLFEQFYTTPDYYFEKISEIIVFLCLPIILLKYRERVNSDFFYFSLFHFLVPVLTGTLISINRLSLYSFPVLLVFFSDLVQSKKSFYITLTILSIWQALGLYLFMNGYFVG